MTGAEAAADKALPYAIKAIRELAKPATQDKLVASLKRYKTIPKLSWWQRGRLTTAIGSEAAANALMDPDPAALSVLVAEALREPASDKSLDIAHALINEYPGCVDGAEQAIALGFQVRRVREAVDAQGEQLGGLSHTVDALYRINVSAPGRIDPEVLLSGPLDGLNLNADYQRVAALSGDDPASAAALLSTMIERIESAGYPLMTRPFRRQFADLLAQAEQYESAADEWLPMVDDSFSGGFGFGHLDACNSWAVMAMHEGAPGWLVHRRSAVIVLDHCIMGDRSAGTATQYAIAAADAGDPAGPVWLMHAAEACLADGEMGVVDQYRQRLLAAAALSSEPMVVARLRLAVADATRDEDLWGQLEASTVPGTAGTPSEVAALILARRGRKAFREGQLDSAVTWYRQAAGRGGQVKNWQDAANWAASALAALRQTDSILESVLSPLQDQESAWRDAGPGSLLDAGYDMRGVAMEKLLEIAGGKKMRARSARVDLRRYLRRAIVLGEINNELDAHQLLCQMYLLLGDSAAGLRHALAAGDVTRAGQAAAKLASYQDCLPAAQSPVPNSRAAGLRAAFGQADLIPDDMVAQWVRTALDEAKARTTTVFEADPYIYAYDALRGLANRVPDDLVAELLDAIAGRLPDKYGLLGEQIAHILIGLGRHSRDHHQPRIADLIAITFEHADDIADVISDSARSLTVPLTMIADRLRALLPGEYRPRQRYAALTLAVIGDKSPQFIDYAEAAVAEQLPDPDTGRPTGAPGNCEDAAILAAALPMQRRAELARYCSIQVVDTDADETTRMRYANACRLAAAGLPDEIRTELFDRIFPQRRPSESQHPRDVARRQFENPFGFIQISVHSAQRLQRHIAKALAALATDDERRDRVWKAAQQIAVSGSSIDLNTVGDVAFELAKAGYAAQLPWAAMACSSDANMRSLAAALVPYTPEADAELVTNLAGDSAVQVRRELAQSIVNIDKATSGDDASTDDVEWIGPVVEILRDDRSFRVRQILDRLN